jgi:hypothetical protein
MSSSPSVQSLSSTTWGAGGSGLGVGAQRLVRRRCARSPSAPAGRRSAAAAAAPAAPLAPTRRPPPPPYSTQTPSPHLPEVAHLLQRHRVLLDATVRHHHLRAAARELVHDVLADEAFWGGGVGQGFQRESGARPLLAGTCACGERLLRPRRRCNATAAPVAPNTVAVAPDTLERPPGPERTALGLSAMLDMHRPLLLHAPPPAAAASAEAAAAPAWPARSSEGEEGWGAGMGGRPAAAAAAAPVPHSAARCARASEAPAPAGRRPAAAATAPRRGATLQAPPPAGRAPPGAPRKPPKPQIVGVDGRPRGQWHAPDEPSSNPQLTQQDLHRRQALRCCRGEHRGRWGPAEPRARGAWDARSLRTAFLARHARGEAEIRGTARDTALHAFLSPFTQ